ncbi:MAG: hypothetical protein CMJ25_13695 [Phycisphaerae bacterium]|nr:hypothetical protein [Phycisphaerae bacterium]
MPIVTIKTPSGESVKIEAPEGATDNQILMFAKSQGLFDEKQNLDQQDFIPTDEALSAPLPEQKESSVLDKIKGAGEAALTLGTGATAGALGYGLGSIEGAIGELTGRIPRGEGQKVAEEYASDLTYSPKSEEGQGIVSAITEPLSVLPPIIGTTPVSTLRAAIPKRRVPKNIMKNSAMKKAMLKREMAEGNPNIETLAKTLNSEGDIVTNKISKSALKTIGDTELNRETISVLERLDPASKKQVSKMLDNITNKKKFPDLDVRPSHVMGESIGNRAQALATKNKEAGKRIGNIAKSLKNKEVNIQSPINDFFTELDGLGVKFKKGDDGWVTPDFSRSKFTGGNQKDMNVLINDLLNPSTKFESSHKLKQDIRKNINFDRAGPNRMDRDSQKILKRLSSGIDDVLDTESTAYKKANQRFSKTIDLKDRWEKSAGKDIDLFDDLSSESLALKGRRMSSNAASGPEFKKLMTDTDEALKGLGVNFKDNIHSLNFVVNRLDDLFKITPETSIQGVIERGVDASFSPVAAARQGLESVKTALSASDTKKISALKALMRQK